jgi:hypothetical protein
LVLYADFFADNQFSKEINRYKHIKLLEPQCIPLDLDLYSDYSSKNINVNDKLSTSQKKIIEDTLYMQVFMVGTIGALLLLPESVTKWDLDSLEDKSLSQRWKYNVKAGPVMDKDDFFINYIGHPVSGAWYYNMARNDGLDEFDSFLFSVFVSTFIWEYGYEAFAEIPSIQDLIATPVVGAFIGEYFHYLEKQLDKNRGLIWNNQSLGNISYFLLDPIGNVSGGLSKFFNVNVTMRFETYQPLYSIKQSDYNQFINKPAQFSNFEYSLILNFEF